MLRNSAAETFYGGFTASKIRRPIRRAVIFPADFRRTNIRRRIRRSAAAEGSMHGECIGQFCSERVYSNGKIGDESSQTRRRRRPSRFYQRLLSPAKARDYVFAGVGLSVCLFVCYHDN